MSYNSSREKLNIWLYESKVKVLYWFKIVRLLISVCAISSIVSYYGFEHDAVTQENLMDGIKASFAYYIIHYFVRYIYTFDPRKFFRKTWFEALLMLFLLAEGVTDICFDYIIMESFFRSIGIQSFSDFSTVFLQLYLLIILTVELTKENSLLPNTKLHPSSIFILSFLAIICVGSFLLMMPEMTVQEGSMNFLDALFMSTSATCVTGLGVVDTATFFTFKGHVIILFMIKLGGLNIIAFGAFFALLTKFGLGLKHDEAIEDFVNKDSLFSAKGLLGKIIIWSTMIEIFGAVLMYYSWDSSIPFKSNGDKIFSSIFHSFSAFNNAGLSLFTDGMYNIHVRENYIIHIVVILLVFFGALGFTSIFDLFSIRALRERMKTPWKTLQFSTKISLYFSLGLVALGTVAFFFLEKDNTIKDMTIIEQGITSLFQSVTRTSGFNTVDIGAMTMPMLILMLFLMFVGSSSSSTGGGIKTSSLGLICASIIATIRGRKHPQLFKRSISPDLIAKAFAVLLFFILGNLICIFLLSISEGQILAQEGRTIMDLIFEEVSAFGTVGLSTGITSELSSFGRYVIVVSMIIGRVGTLTVAFAIGKKVLSTNYKYPQGHTMVG